MKIYKYNTKEYTNDEVEYFKSFVDTKSGKISIQTAVAHRFTKLLLSQKLGIPDIEIKFSTTIHGKPYFDCKYKFSITHTGNYVFIAIDEKEIGIDAEMIKKVNPKLLSKVANDNEIIYAYTDNFDIEFLKLWTVKEAYFKLKGTGITNFKAINTQEIKEKYSVKTEVTDTYVLSVIY